MPVTLDEIVAATRHRVAEARRASDLRGLERRAESHVPRGFREKLKSVSKTAIAVIAELKKASPSRGLIRADFNPQALARDFENAGAAALSVLTDEQFFQGSLENLRLASGCTQLPCLRKDFIVDEFQLVEARANCADAVLLIVAALSESSLVNLARKSQELGLDVLCEAHDERELKRALDAGCDLVGINNRDLRTFQVNVETTLRLGPMIPKEVVSVAESGIHTGRDIANLQVAGYRAFLIGESLMKAERPGEALRLLLHDTPTMRSC